MCREVYCKKCILKSSNPGITIDDNGLCNICNGEHNNEMIRHYRKSIASYKKFEKNVRLNPETRNYDCIVMFSGGKDSINIVERMTNQEKLRVLPVTIDLPFESEKAKEHMQFVTNALDVDYMTIKPSKKRYIEMMQCIFKEEYNGAPLNMEKTPKFKHLGPCIMCTCFMTLLTCLLAKHLNIPYVLYCADPSQIANLPIGLDNVLDVFRNMFDDEFINKVCSDNIDCIDKTKTDWVPDIIYPYIAIPDYNQDKIIERLKSLHLYNTTPQEGHCTLWALLNYNAIIRYNSPFYILDYASGVRYNQEKREEVIQLVETFEKLLVKVVKNGFTREDDRMLKQLISNFVTTEGEVNYIYNNIHQLDNISKELGIDLKE